MWLEAILDRLTFGSPRSLHLRRHAGRSYPRLEPLEDRRLLSAVVFQDNMDVAAAGTLTFAPGETSKTIVIAVKRDRRKEANETFFLNLSAAGNALIDDAQALGTIVNDDRR